MASTNEAKAAAVGELGYQYERLPSPHATGQGYGSQAAGAKGEDADSNGAAVASKPLLRINSMASCPSGALPPGCAQRALHVVGGAEPEAAGPEKRWRSRFPACVVTRKIALNVRLPWLGSAVGGQLTLLVMCAIAPHRNCCVLGTQLCACGTVMRSAFYTSHALCTPILLGAQCAGFVAAKRLSARGARPPARA